MSFRVMFRVSILSGLTGYREGAIQQVAHIMCYTLSVQEGEAGCTHNVLHSVSRKVKVFFCLTG